MTVYLNSTVSAIDGYIGNYLTSLESGDTGETEEYEHGIIIITTGGVETVPDSYLYGDPDGHVLTQLELESDLEENEKKYNKLKSVVMIQCVGSRDDDHPYCSRVCCTQAVKNAIRLKELNKKMNVYILYRDIRTYGFNEEYYQQARNLGVIFIRYEDDKNQLSNTLKMAIKRKSLSVANIASLDADVCAGCGMCVSVCPYSAPSLIWQNGRQVCSINTALCKVCGSCSTVCPSGAMEQLGYSEEQTLEMVNFSLVNL